MKRVISMLSCILKIKKTVVLAVSLVTAVFVLVLSDGMRQGVRQGLSLCANSVVPSLFVFTAVAMFLAYSGVADTLGRLISPITRLLFGLEGSCAMIFLLSTVSGYPVGARLIDSELENGRLLRTKALKMLVFSVNAGPAFILIAVGKGVLSSASDGRRLLLAHLLATAILAAVTRFLPDRLFSKTVRLPTTKASPDTQKLAVSDALVLSVSHAAETMLTLSAFVVFFAGFSGIISQSALPFKHAVRCVLEVTVGVQGCSRGQLPLVAFLLGFGGISVIFQVKSAARHVAPPLLLIIASRLVHGAVSAGLVTLFEIISPRTISTGSFGVAGSTVAVHTNPFAAVSLLLLCVVLLCFTHTAVSSKNRT